MSTYNDASLILYPSGYKEDKLYSLKPTDGSGDLDFTRASTATRVNAEGLIETSPVNLAQQSNTFNTTWGPAFATVTSGQAGYDGTNNAWLLSKNYSTGRIGQGVSYPLGQYTYSIYAKAGTDNFILLGIEGMTIQAFFDLQNGTLGSSYFCTSSIVFVSDGWYRCSMTFNSAITIIRIYVADADNDTSGTSGSIYIQDAQLEQGATAKPYFPTTDRLNVPRIDYTGGGCGKLLLEPQRSNVVLQSEDISSASWTKTAGVTVTANALISPDGTTNADYVQYDAVNKELYQNITSVTGGVATIYIKGTAGQTIKFGVTGDESVYTLSGEWERLTKTFTVTSSRITINTYASSTSRNIYLWGAQVEGSGATYPTSYIPTTSTAVTRVADTAFKTGISSLIGQTEGVLYANVQFNLLGNLDSWLSINNGTNSNWIFIGKTNNKIRAYVKGSGSIAFDNYVTNITSGQLMKIAIAYKSGDIALYINGSLIATSTNSFTFSAALSLLSFHNSGGASSVIFEISKYQEVLIFPTRLSNTDLAALTTL
mgnify:CR=1 FL=1